ncbi:unnamed protein product, partial [Vitis vinifera]|uniref:Uncharacterized protein n=1 Tax=Vitis vinifera TaxID=29760 RepID=D7T365_VITVI
MKEVIFCWLNLNLNPTFFLYPSCWMSFVLSARIVKLESINLTTWSNLVNHVYFSPDGQWVASASFDKSVKLWNGATGKFVAAFRGHVGPVYQISWSADSRLLFIGSKDSTLKVNCRNYYLPFMVLMGLSYG